MVGSFQPLCFILRIDTRIVFLLYNKSGNFAKLLVKLLPWILIAFSVTRSSLNKHMRPYRVRLQLTFLIHLYDSNLLLIATATLKFHAPIQFYAQSFLLCYYYFFLVVG